MESQRSPERAPSRARSARCTRQSRPRVVQHTARTRREGTRRGAASATALHEAASEPDPLRRVHDLAFDPDLEIDERAAIRRSNGAESLAGFELVTDG